MPCDFAETVAERERQRALDELEKKLRSGRVKVEVDASGQFRRFVGWEKVDRQLCPSGPPPTRRLSWNAASTGRGRYAHQWSARSATGIGRSVR